MRAPEPCNLIRSEHAHASYPGLFFRPPGFSPYMGREERRVQGLDYMPGMTVTLDEVRSYILPRHHLLSPSRLHSPPVSHPIPPLLLNLAAIPNSNLPLSY